MSNFKYLTQSDVAIKIELLRTSAADLQADIHQCAVSTLDHVRIHGDTRGITQLLNALPNGQRVKGLAAWYRAFSSGVLNLKVNKESKQWEVGLKHERIDSDFKMTEAEGTDFGAYTAEREPMTLTLDKFLKRIESISNNSEENTDGTPKVDSAARIMAAEVVAFVRKTQLLKVAA